MGLRHLPIFLLFIFCLHSSLIAGPLKVHFIDVGQGDAIFIESPSGKNLLIDAGDDGDNAGEKIIRYLAKIGVDDIDTFLLTHPHDDHYGGVFALVGQVNIGKFLYGTHVDGKKYTKMVKKVKGAGIPYRHIEAGYRFDLGPGVSALAIHSGPPQMRGVDSTVDVDREDDGRGSDLNRCSVVVRLVHGQSSYLLTGDATKHVEKDLLANGIDVSATVYKAAHHGSRYSNTKEFLAAVNPRWGVIQVGAGNHHGHPHAPAVQRMEEVCEEIFRNDTGGTIYSYSTGATCVINSRPQPIVERQPDGCVPVTGSNESDFAFSELFTFPSIPLRNETCEITFNVSNLAATQQGLTIEVFENFLSADFRICQLDDISIPANGLADIRLPWKARGSGKGNLYVLVKNKEGKLLASHGFASEVKGRTLVVDNSHGNWLVATHKTSAFLTDLKRQGYEVKLHDSGAIDESVLKGASALLLISPNAPYGQEETSAILRFLENGGGLWVSSLARSADRASNELLQNLSSKTTISNTSTQSGRISLATMSAEWSGGTFTGPLLLTNSSPVLCPPSSSATVLAKDGQSSLLVAEKMGRGRLLVAGGSFFANAGYRNYKELSHSSVVGNRVLVDWLSGRKVKERTLANRNKRKELFR